MTDATAAAEPLRCAVLDDHQGAATTLADWSGVTARGVRVVTYGHHHDDGDQQAPRLAGLDLVVTLRERVALPASHQ
ncbi:hypothetical protein ACWGHI_33460, partial [Streptomyces sp. NPDC054912]